MLIFMIDLLELPQKTSSRVTNQSKTRLRIMSQVCLNETRTCR